MKLLIASGLLNVDETGWKEHKVTRWLWAAIGDDVAYYTVGPCSSETAEKILKGFEGWLMTDGYGVYRKFEKRLRCWSHLDRKAKALKDSWDKEAASFGKYAVKALESFRQKVYNMREMEPTQREEIQSICDKERLDFIYECLRKQNSDHEKTRAFSVEILNDHEAIFQVLKNPDLDLTNNRAEQFLRCWVILRYMCHGSKTEEGSQTVAILASIIYTIKIKIW